MRSRTSGPDCVVAWDCGVGNPEDCFYAYVPPSEAEKILLAKAPERYGKWQSCEEDVRCQVIFIAVKTSYLEATCKHTDVELLPEDAREGCCAKLQNWLYRMWCTARGWEHEYPATVISVGSTPGT